MKLDPTALDAAKRAFEDTRNTQPYPSMAWRDDEAVADNDRMDTEAFAAAITVYLTALAPQTRERVGALIMSERGSERGFVPDSAAYDARTALLSLLGAEETE